MPKRIWKMQVHDVKSALLVQSARSEWHSGRQRDARYRPEVRDTMSCIAKISMLVAGTAAIGDKIDDFYPSGHPTQECSQIALDSTNISIELAKMKDFQAFDRP